MGIFTRDETENLSYDADAFLYFALTMLTVLVVPWTVALLRGLLWPRPAVDQDFDAKGPAGREAVIKHCTVSCMEEKRRQSVQEAQTWRRRLGGFVWLQLLAVVILWMLLGCVVRELRDAPAQLRSFDPYAILGISHDADAREIKKAYRTKSLQHHPDKDRDNPLAHLMFQQVAKAHAALTDEGARRNYAKYGNPDGPGKMKVGVALHPVLLAGKERQLATLCIFFSIIILVPSAVLCCCLRGPRLSAGGVSSETLRMLNACIDEEVTCEDGPGLLGASTEARRAACADLRHLAKAMLENLPQPFERGLIVGIRAPGDNGKTKPFVARGIIRTANSDKRVAEVEVRENANEEPKVSDYAFDLLTPLEPRAPCPFSDPPVRRNAALLWAHMWRLHSHMTPSTQAELNVVLRHSVPIGRAMVQIAAHGYGDRGGFTEVVRGLVRFRRCLVQALDFDSSPLLQIPHVTRNSSLPKRAPSLKEVIDGGAAKFCEMLRLNSQQRLDVDGFCRHVPRVKVSSHVEVSDEEGVAEGDVATLTVTLERTHLCEGEAVGPVHAPFFPGVKYEEWWLLVYDERCRRLVTVDLIQGTGRRETAKMNFLVPRSGEFRWTVYAMCDSYEGLDVQCDCHFHALKYKEVSHDVKVHPQDMHIKTFFEELMEGLNPEFEEESESEDEMPLSKAAPKAAIASSASAVTLATGADAAASPSADPASAGSQAARTNGDAEADSDSDDEGGEGDNEQEGLFFKVTASGGKYIYREPREEVDARLGSIPSGNIIRCLELQGSPPGWALLAGAGSAWVNVGSANGEAKSAESAGAGESDSTVSAGGLEPLGSLCDLPFHVLVQVRPPLLLIRRWMKQSSAAQRGDISAEDILQVQNIEEPRIRTHIEEMLRNRTGDAPYEALMDEADALKEKRRKRILKARGFFASQNGIIWHVNPTGNVRGLWPDGQRIRDKVHVTEDDHIMIGPFSLDETRTCSCIHWMRKENSEQAWVWARDRSLKSRVRLGPSW
mmetsp:Transcript_90051/g.158796  ORF Transcript_90051/g.158796 Transcript_90051/m.158796 type:complete len:1006 (-) Transcript_90051:48-3065(-)